MDEDAAERLRRRLYAPGATEDDIARYRGSAVVASEPDRQRQAPEARPRRRPRRRAAAVLLGAAAVAAAAALLPVVGSPAEPTPSPSVSRPSAAPIRIAEPVRLPLEPVDLPGDDSASRIAGLFSGSALASSVAADDFGALVMLRAAPEARSADLLRSGSGGSSGPGPTRVALPDIAVQLGDLVVLSVVTLDPARVTWRFTAAGTDGATALIAASGKERVAAGSIRLAGDAIVDGLVIEHSGSTPLRYRYAVYRRRLDSPFGRDVSSVNLRCAFDRYSGETRCVRGD